MKRLLAWTAAALLAASGTAFAKGSTTISLDTFCDVLVIQKNKVLHTALEMSEDAPTCENFYGAGFVSKVKTFGNVAVIGLRGGTNVAYEYTLEIAYPFVTGGQFVLYGTADGKSLIAFAGGTYTVNGTAPKGAKPLLAAAPH